MDITLKSRLVDVYRRYGFNLARDNARDGILVFTLKTGYFDNAEIIKLATTATTEAIFTEFSKAGYACTIREATSPENTEQELFQGFFSVESTRKRLLDEYRRFSEKIVEPYGPGSTYEYIKAPYQINGKDGLLSPPEEVCLRINDPEPTLFLIEAAAGFGKTCTALEIVKLLANDASHLPLYAELSRNRQARIFRYILLDEIDRTFPLLSSGLVQTEIKNGRIATILDGFDELLRKSEENGVFENKEPMLETVSELLTGRAKVIITTRRTVLFDGDEFHQWLNRHAEAFKVIRIRIQEPRVSDWLTQSRQISLASSGLRIEAMANPVLLSYLRCINDESFGNVANYPERIVESYFTYMLERERERQDLRMNVETQAIILQSIAKDMMDCEYTAEQRDYIVNFILGSQAKLIDETRSRYPASDKPSREEIANKLASHALLDRSSQEPNKISFINDFALGNYVAANITSSNSWLSDDLRFIDPAVRSYSPRGMVSRRRLYTHLSESLPYLDISSQIEIAAELTNALPSELSNDAAENISLQEIPFGSTEISNFQFSECVFRRCKFNPAMLKNVTFLNCRFYDCEVSEDSPGGTVYLLGCLSDPDIALHLSLPAQEIAGVGNSDPEIQADIFNIKKFWPIGELYSQRPSRPLFKPIKIMCRPTDQFTSADLFHSVERLRRRGNLIELNKTGLIALNLESLTLTQEFLRVNA
ncbi:MAG: hypothetical protein ACKVOT_16820 [Polaromonas sp.]